jgi:AcrR family transcriptional regulator
VIDVADTRQRLIEGAFETIRRHGVAGVSARTIAGVANANQALSFYHFGSVDALLELYEAADPDGAGAGLAALEQLGVLLEVVDELGPLARRALAAKINRR